MILKYREFKNNWSYIEAPRFTVSRISLPLIVREEAQTSDEEAEQRADAFREAGRYIEKQTGFFVDDIEYIISGDIRILEGCTVVMADGRQSILALGVEAYLLNDNGKTIERI